MVKDPWLTKSRGRTIFCIRQATVLVSSYSLAPSGEPHWFFCLPSISETGLRGSLKDKAVEGYARRVATVITGPEGLRPDKELKQLPPAVPSPRRA